MLELASGARGRFGRNIYPNTDLDCSTWEHMLALQHTWKRAIGKGQIRGIRVVGANK